MSFGATGVLQHWAMQKLYRNNPAGNVPHSITRMFLPAIKQTMMLQ
jgi:hypothetical protein